MFQEKTFNLGDTKVGVKHKIIFHYTDIEKITKIKACGCMSVTNYVNEHRLEIDYVAEPLPVHLELDGHINYPLNKPITVTCDKFDGSMDVTEVLYITGTVYKN